MGVTFTIALAVIKSGYPEKILTLNFHFFQSFFKGWLTFSCVLHQTIIQQQYSEFCLNDLCLIKSENLMKIEVINVFVLCEGVIEYRLTCLTL